MKLKQLIIYTLITVSLLSATVDGLLYWLQTEAQPITPSLVNLLYYFLLVFWIDIDSKGRPEIIRPFEYSFLVYIFLLPYLPYYLWRTRGASGLIMLIGFLVLPILGGLAHLGIALARSV